MADDDLKTAPPRDEIQVNLAPGPAQTKVELDLDDAPFLQPDIDDDDEQESPPPAVPEAAKKAGLSKAKKKLLQLIAAGMALLLLVAGAAVWWFFLRTPPPEVIAPTPEVIVVPSKAPPSDTPSYVKEFAPFLVPRAGGKNGSHFLVCKFSTLSKDAAPGKEMDLKMISLRDAIYYYLLSKDDAYLMNPANGPTIKADLTAVLNDYLTLGKVEDILFESYLNE